MGGPGQGAASRVLDVGVRLLRPGEQVFTAMLDGWADQQAARGLQEQTIIDRRARVVDFAGHAGTPPWQWSPAMFERWCVGLRERNLAASTRRSYAGAVHLFCDYVTDPVYAWPEVCQGYFGTHPVQVCTRWNTVRHTQDGEGEPSRRAFTVAELQGFFDHLDGRVEAIVTAGRKGWVPAFRDAALIKVAYAFGLRRREVAMLDLTDFSANPHGREFGEFGVVRVRFGKANAGAAPKRRSVLTVWPWTGEILGQWITEVRPLLVKDGTPALWPSERGPRIGLTAIDRRFAAERDAVGLDPALEFHSLRRSYITHLLEKGWDPLFVQQQAGHAHASTTALYSCVSSDFRTRTLRRALTETMEAAQGQGA